MDTATDRDFLPELSSAISCYFSLLSAAGDCLAVASPEVGGFYKTRIEQLRTRLSFQSTPRAIMASLRIMEGELTDYATAAARYLDRRDPGTRGTLMALEQAMDKLSANQAFGGARVRDVAARIEASPPPETASLRALAEQLRGAVQCMHLETGAAPGEVRGEAAPETERFHGEASVDASTGLLNAREMTRQIEAYGSGPVAFSLLRFELQGDVSAPVLKQAARRIERQFRNRDRIARWSEAGFLVLFQGPPEVAETRLAQVAGLLAGRYALETGGHAEIAVQAHLAEQEALVSEPLR